uniref:AAA+ ATPase domain-containing protein n=1 Tax=Moniliophthora roreri TaxID=221103 RepID=A0A0W0F194_MONRR
MSATSNDRLLVFAGNIGELDTSYFDKRIPDGFASEHRRSHGGRTASCSSELVSLFQMQIEAALANALPYAPCLEDISSEYNAPAGSVTDLAKSITDTFILRFVWSCFMLEHTRDAFAFQDDMLSEIHQAISYAFSCRAGTVNVPYSNRTVTLYAPYHGGNAVVDSVVKAAALKANADVLVLDALELAAGDCGALGEAGAMIDFLYDGLPIKGFAEHNDVQQFFYSLVEAGLDTPASSSPRRIIYLRDFGTISCAAVPLMIYLLRTIENLRQSPAYPQPPAIIIVIGGCHPLGYPGRPDKYSNQKGFCTFSTSVQQLNNVYYDHQTLLKEGGIPNDEMPLLDNKVYISDDMPFANLSSAFFAPILTPYHDEMKELSVCYRPSGKSSNGVSGQDDAASEPAFWEDQVKSLATSTLAFSVYSKAIDASRQHAELEERASAVNAILLKLLLAQKGVNVTGKLHGVSSGDLFEKREGEVTYSILLPSSIDTIFDILIMLLGNQSTSAVPPDVVVDAVQAWIHRYQRLESWIDSENQRNQLDIGGDSSHNNGEKPGMADPVVEAVRRSWDLSSHEKKLLSCIVDSCTLSTAFQDVCLDRRVIENLRSIVSLPLLHPQQFRSGILSRESLSGVLLYGPPGTGKTMVCRALACESGARMLLVKPSDVFDMYVGESEKYARAVFNLADRLAPCVVFIDEVDSLFGARSSRSGGRDVHRAMLTEFMQCMDGLLSKDKGVIIVGATNRPYDLDAAILRRLPCRMLVDLPDERQRRNILQSHLKGEILDGVDLGRIASQTEGYSGSDLKNLCVSAAMEALKDCIGGLGKGSMFEATTAVAAEKSNQPTPPNRVIRMDHFGRAFAQVTASFTFEGNKALYEWHQKYGSNPDEVSLFAKRCMEDGVKGSPPPKSENGNMNLDASQIQRKFAKTMLTMTSMLSGIYHSS